jgi:hypothetical protein
MMNTFQFISSIGGAGAPEGNEVNEDFVFFVGFCFRYQESSLLPVGTR